MTIKDALAFTVRLGRVLRAIRGGHSVPETERAMARLAATDTVRAAERLAQPYTASPVRAMDGLAPLLLDEARADLRSHSPAP